MKTLTSQLDTINSEAIAEIKKILNKKGERDGIKIHFIQKIIRENINRLYSVPLSEPKKEEAQEWTWQPGKQVNYSFDYSTNKRNFTKSPKKKVSKK